MRKKVEVWANATGVGAAISIDGYKGRWTFVDHRCINGRWLHLLENDKYGEDCGHIIINDRGEVVADGVYNGFDD